MNYNESIKSINHVKAHSPEKFDKYHDGLALLHRLSISTKSITEGKGESVKAAFLDIRNKIKKRLLK